MAKVTWYGEPDAREMTWKGIKFKAGEEVEISDEELLKKIKANPTFKVGGPEAMKRPAEPQPTERAPAKPLTKFKG